MFVVDTNVLIYAADADCPEHMACAALLEQWRRQAAAWCVTWGILYEFVRVVTHPRVFRTPWTPTEAWRFVELLLASPGLQVLVETDRHLAVAKETLAQLPSLGGNLVHDAHIVNLMREHGIINIYTRDADFYRFPFLNVVDPLSSGGRSGASNVLREKARRHYGRK